MPGTERKFFALGMFQVEIAQLGDLKLVQSEVPESALGTMPGTNPGLSRRTAIHEFHFVYRQLPVAGSNG
jgi:hypothetical protein